MAFTEKIKLEVRRLSAFRCCRCQSIGVDIHHIIPQAENGPDTIENAAPLCPTCHDDFGANPVKQKAIREMRDYWFEQVSSGKYLQVNKSRQYKRENTTVNLSGLELAKLGVLKESPIQHDFLPQSLINRIKIIHKVFLKYWSVPLDQTIENFRRDKHPETEVEVWERMALVVLSLENNHQWDHSKIQSAFSYTLQLSIASEAVIDTKKIALSDSELELVRLLWGSDPIVPISVKKI